MKSIERVFKKIEETQPGWGPYIVLARTVNGNDFSKDRIARMFGKLVPKGDYNKSEKKALLANLYCLTMPLNRTKKAGNDSPGREKRVRASISTLTHANNLK